MKKLYGWIAQHKVKTVLICVGIFALPLIIVNMLYKWYLGIDLLIPEWEPGEVLAYIAGFEAFIGTVFLGIVSFEQSRRAEEVNKKLSEENNYLQKIMSQRLMPVVRADLLKASPPMKNYKESDFLPCTSTFKKFICKSNEIKPVNVFLVNVDVKQGTPAYFAELTLSLCNISEAPIRHICVDNITVCGYKGIFSEIRCSNETPKNGVSSLLTTGDTFTMQVMFYFNNEKIKTCWNSELGGSAISLFLTNTTITGIKFQEYIDVRVGGNGYSRISYGEGVFEEGEKDNA